MVILALLVAGTVAAAGLIGFVYYKETHLPPIGDFDTIIVLGAQVKADGTPSVALERRLTAALEEYRKKPSMMIVASLRAADDHQPRLLPVFLQRRRQPPFQRDGGRAVRLDLRAEHDDGVKFADRGQMRLLVIDKADQPGRADRAE